MASVGVINHREKLTKSCCAVSITHLLFLINAMYCVRIQRGLQWSPVGCFIPGLSSDGLNDSRRIAEAVPRPLEIAAPRI